MVLVIFVYHALSESSFVKKPTPAICEQKRYISMQSDQCHYYYVAANSGPKVKKYFFILLS